MRALEKACNDLADKAADFGRKRLPAGVIDAERLCLAAFREWCPVVYDLHRFFIAIAGAVVYEDGHGDSATHPIVWDRRRHPEKRKVHQAVREFAWAPGPPDHWRHGSVGWPAIHVNAADVAVWPCSAGMLVKLCAFLCSLHWPTVVEDFGISGISFMELLIPYERWAGERLVWEYAFPKA